MYDLLQDASNFLEPKQWDISNLQSAFFFTFP
jgi:hypothetical protein